jgi:hypothetical protein
MKLFITLVIAFASSLSMASTEMVLSAECMNRSETKYFEILVPKGSDNFESIKPGLQVIVKESSNVASSAVITKSSKQFVTLSLEDGRKIQFAQDGGYNTKLGSEKFICSNPLGF